MLDSARRLADLASSQVLRAWLAAAHGEALAAQAGRTASLHAFDQAAALLPNALTGERPYVVLDSVHLARWRGHVLACFGDPDAIAILINAFTRLFRLAPSFVRAETALRVDLAIAHAANGDQEEARTHAEQAHAIAGQLGSTRQRRRLQILGASFQ